MSNVDKIKTELINWAKNKNIEIDDDAYVKNLDDNFIVKLSEESLRDLKGGDGSEIKDDKTRTKIFALHSSSALVCNFFEYWRFRDKSALAKALNFNQGIKSLVYEQKLSMGMQGKMPNLDIFMVLTDGQAVAIESKFTEWMSKNSKKKPFAESYKARDRWEEVGLPKCQKIVNEIVAENETYSYLNAPQLLKHALGLASMHSNKSELIYLYYHLESPVSETHKKEIKRFKEALNGELNFREITYQDVFERLKNMSKSEHKLFDELESKYFNIVN